MLSPKQWITILSICLFIASVRAQEITRINLIPQPLSLEISSGVFRLDHHTTILFEDPNLKRIASLMQRSILKYGNIGVSTGSRADSNTIELKSEKSMPAEGYQLSIETNQIQLQASDESGFLNGLSTLLQLVDHGEKEAFSHVYLPQLEIEDAPHYSWRGMMLDVSRYFIAKDKIKQIVDWMFYYKLNKLHLHLTDSPAWRLEIKQYPNLALIGGIGDHNNPEKKAQFLTHDDIQDLVDYASRRGIEIIPEIDMPGHATAANRAYPEYSGGGSDKYPEFTFDPGNEKTYHYLANILKEVNAIFPSSYLHLGGDEVSFGNHKWKDNPGIQNLMRDNNLEDLKEVEYYFMSRMADSLFEMNKVLVAWDELANIDLPRDKTVIFWWRHDKPEQLVTSLEKGYKTVICPRIPYYFDFVQDSAHRHGRRWGGEFSTLEGLYHFRASDWADIQQYGPQILGVQANLWTETVDREERVDYLIFPRIAALSESAWVEKRSNFKGFQKRLQTHLQSYEKNKIYYFNPFDPEQHQEPFYFKGK